MKSEQLIKRVLCFALVIFMAVFCGITAFAVGEDGEGGEVVPVETQAQPETVYVPETTQYVAPETVYEPPTTQYVAPETVYEAPTTQYVEQTTPQQDTTAAQYGAYVDTQPSKLIDSTAPTVAKTVSTKKYNTNNTAGIVSWVCVIIGVLAVSIVMVSTKVSARRAARRR